MKRTPIVLRLFLPATLALLFSTLPIKAQTAPGTPPVKPAAEAPRQLIRNGGFTDGETSWRLEQIAPVQGDFSVTQEGPNNAPCARVELVTPGDAHWKMSFQQFGFKVTAGKRYRVSFMAKATEAHWIDCGLKQHLAPYKGLAYQNPVAIGTSWAPTTLIFKPKESEENARFYLGNMGQTPGTFWFTAISVIEE